MDQVIPENYLEEEYGLDEDQIEKLGMSEEQQEEGGLDYPKPKEEQSLFSLFKKVLFLKDNSKVANLKKEELGDLGWSVRDCKRLAFLSEWTEHQKLAVFARDMAENTLRTSASRNGWFTELFVTQKKYSQKSNINDNLEQQIGQPQAFQPQQRRKWKWGM